MLNSLYWISASLLGWAPRLRRHSHTLVYSSPRKYHVPVWSRCLVLEAGIEPPKFVKNGHRGCPKKIKNFLFIITLKNEEGWEGGMWYEYKLVYTLPTSQARLLLESQEGKDESRGR